MNYGENGTTIFLNDDTAKLLRKFAENEAAKIHRKIRAYNRKVDALYSELYAAQDLVSSTNHLVSVPDTEPAWS